MTQIVSIKEVRKKSRRRRRKTGTIRWILVVIFLLCCGVSGYTLAQSELFYVHEITVEGNQQLALEDILSTSGLKTGSHIYAANLKGAKRALENIYLVKEADISRVLPDKIHIKIEERQPVAMVQANDALLAIDSEGVLLKRQTLVEGLPLMLISGVQVDDSSLYYGDKLDADNLAAGLQIVNSLNSEASSVLAEIDVSNTQNIVAHTIYGVDLKLGDSNKFLEKFTVFMEIIRDETEKNNISRIQYVDVSIVDRPAVMYNSAEESKDKGS